VSDPLRTCSGHVACLTRVSDTDIGYACNARPNSAGTDWAQVSDTLRTCSGHVACLTRVSDTDIGYACNARSNSAGTDWAQIPS